MKIIISILLITCSLFAQTNSLSEIKTELTKKYKAINFDKLIALANSEIVENPKDPVCYYWLGTILNEKNYENGKNIPDISFSESIRSSEKFEKVIDLDPDYYENINILDPYTSLTSIWGAQAISYKYANKLDSMEIAFEEGKKRGAFNDASLGFCKNILNSAAKDSYLFISGDNYTFPFFYLQNYLNIRNDVIVIDLGLANAKWYAKYLIKNNIITENYDGNSIIENNYISFKDTVQTIRLQYDKRINWDIKLKNNYLTRANLILKQIIEEKASIEEIYFPPFFDKSALIGLEKHLLDQGTILQLSDSRSNTIGAKYEVNLLSGSYKYLSDKTYLNSYDAAILNDFYRYQFMRLIHSKIIDKNVGGTIQTYDYYVEWSKGKYFKSSSDEIDDYILRIKKIAEDIKSVSESE